MFLEVGQALSPANRPGNLVDDEEAPPVYT
jgi:hypothetical protein